MTLGSTYPLVGLWPENLDMLQQEVWLMIIMVIG
ncbi:hypothetical protein Godav_015129 [Gossypium davidsonii]|uniref:Uncharacterized protein n=1 Tax=Gossypium davidsonii TaxID=34287 RepID=A0A7J8RMZ9_GOSDV|nr:hypothetical protein [Gossypium davidsonii]